MSFRGALTGVCQCPFGAAPSVFNVLPAKMVLSSALPMANMLDNVPLLNIMPFGVCASLAYPPTLAATIAAFGVLTPMPCVPLTPAPWIPSTPQVLVRNIPIVNQGDKVMCMWGGVITLNIPGQFKVM